MTSVEGLTERIGRILLIWSIVSIVIGIALYFFSFVPLLQGFGLQGMIWGVIGLVLYFTVMKRKEHPLEKVKRELKKSIRMDFIYLLIGVIILALSGMDQYLVGNGFGIIIQGVFLLGFDLYYQRRLE